MRLHHRVYGEGPAVIILHGLFGSLDNWAMISQRLSAHFQVFAVDQRNHGESPHSERMDYRLMAEDLREFMEEQGLANARVLGHSMGGKTAMQFALLYPARVERLVVADMAPRAYEPAHQYIFDALLALDLNRFQNRGQIEESLAGRIPELAVRRFLLKNLARNPAGAFHWKFNLRGLCDNYASLIAAVASDRPFAGPTLFIHGGKSNYLRETDLPGIRRLFPGTEIECITEAGHWLHAEAPAIFLERVEKFLRKQI
jgi:pimeloyl-ACP methyl ester carboxylesterase